jgi:hypothetical protein
LQASLAGSNLTGVNLSKANLSDVDLGSANLTRAATLVGASIPGWQTPGAIWPDTTCPNGTNSRLYADGCNRAPARLRRIHLADPQEHPDRRKTAATVFDCVIKIPNGINTGKAHPYWITVSENGGHGFKTAPANGGTVNPEYIYFK